MVEVLKRPNSTHRKRGALTKRGVPLVAIDEVLEPRAGATGLRRAQVIGGVRIQSNKTTHNGFLVI